MTLKVPPFVEIKYDEAFRKTSVSVEDSSIERQRAMWGACADLPASFWLKRLY